MTTVRALVLLCVLTTAAALGVAPASATTTGECQGQLADLRSSTVAAGPSFTNSRSVDGLVGKLDAASAKLTTGQDADAVAKIVDYQDTLGALVVAPKTKVDPAVAQDLLGQSQGVVDCLSAIDTP